MMWLCLTIPIHYGIISIILKSTVALGQQQNRIIIILLIYLCGKIGLAIFLMLPTLKKSVKPCCCKLKYIEVISEKQNAHIDSLGYRLLIDLPVVGNVHIVYRVLIFSHSIHAVAECWQIMLPENAAHMLLYIKNTLWNWCVFDNYCS